MAATPGDGAAPATSSLEPSQAAAVDPGAPAAVDGATSAAPDMRATQSSNPSDPGAEATDAAQAQLALVPEPGIGMAAAAAETDTRSTESAT